MNNTEGRYQHYFLVREMLGVKNVLAAMAPVEIFDFSAQIKHKKVLLTGEGSSRIFPAKKVIYDARQHNYKENIITEGASQALEYDLDGHTVFIASNSGRTKECVYLLEALKKKNHDNIMAVVAHKDSVIMNGADHTYLLKSGHEKAVAATKTVIEQALFYDILFRKSNGKDCPDLNKTGELFDLVLQKKIPDTMVNQLAASDMIYFSGRNNGVSEELALKTNEITGKKSDYLEGTYAVHGVEEAMSKNEVMIIIDPFLEEETKIQRMLVETIGVIVIAIASRTTSFPTLQIPDSGEFTPYLQMAMGWNLLIETALALKMDLDHPKRARKIGNEYEQPV
ncbi:SIS domain-containing protein [uncultured Desulfobacter sp.]|uniref:SIS domain-containing protein n=1 Tax=uncultured Desulfobacter sp. TaxID=240139 RepID=UPI002AAAF38E|nr:SIS domain-containing protein [uncultured Desulfobacter sp.]